VSNKVSNLVNICGGGSFRHFFLCMLPVAVARSSSDRVTKSQGEWMVLGGQEWRAAVHALVGSGSSAPAG